VGKKMKGKLIIILCVLLLAAIPTVSRAERTTDTNNDVFDPGWIRGPIWGRIDGYEFSGNDNDHLVFYAKNVHYFGIGHAFNAGFYPRHWRNTEITCRYSFFEGKISTKFICGTISGLPGQ
jgi:hypothetical protein